MFMKAKPECIVCAYRQALNAAGVVSDDPAFHCNVLDCMTEVMNGVSLEQTPAALSKSAYRIVCQEGGVSDPYLEEKKRTGAIAMGMLPQLRALLADAEDPLEFVLHAAVAGNVIDLGIAATNRDNIEPEILEIMRNDFAVSAIDRFRKEIRPGAKLLYLGDNAGEILFDRLLVEFLLKNDVEVMFTVKSGPIINDATLEDAESAGIADLVPVIETGSDDIGVCWNNVSAEFLSAFQNADVVLSKGQGNFETCDDRPENIYFLLKAKCAVVALELGVELGDIAFKCLHR